MSTIRPTISISELPVAISLDGGEYFPLVQGGTTKRATISLVAGASSDIQVGLNSISSTQGAVIFRGATAWEGLAPSTSGYLLSTQGAGADPTWVSSSALGSLTIGTTAITSGTTTRILYDDAGFLGEYTLSGGGTAVAMANSPIFTTPSLDVATAISINGLTISSSTGTLTVANSSSLITSGAFATTLTVTGTTGVTLPTTGTLATLAGAEELTNKTLNASVGKGTWTASGTWTLPAVTLAGILTTQSGRIQAVRVVTAAGAITAATTDDVIVVNKTVGAATTVNLFATPATGTALTIKDGKGDANTNNITITPAAGNIDGAGTYVMAANYQSATIIYNGTSWSVI